MTTSSPAFTLRETRIATRLGVCRDTLRQLRTSGALERGVDWEFGTQGSVCYAEGSVNKIMQHLSPGSQPTTENAAPSENGAGDAGTTSPLSSDGQEIKTAPAVTQEAAEAVEKAAAEVVVLVCQSNPGSPGAHHYRNPRVIQAHTPSGELVTVRTHDSRMYRRGQRLEAYNDGNGWIVSGRAPRRAGRSSV